MYTIGQKVCLWQIAQEVSSNQVRVLKEVIVTITEIKTGVPGEFSREPVSSQSLRGTGDNGKNYEKHWGSWPESQTDDFVAQWSLRDDGAGGERFWVPREAIYVYGDVSRLKQRGVDLALVGSDGQPINPKGDIEYCQEHDSYRHKGVECLFCKLGKKAA